MSHDLTFEPCRFDGTTVRRVNPFTAEEQEMPRNEITEAEARAVRAVLVRACGEPGEGDEVFVFTHGDGARAEIYADALVHGCMFAIRGRGITPSLASLLYEVLVTGNWVLGGDAPWVIAPNADAVKRAPPDFAEVKIAASVDALAELLAPGFRAFAGFRDHALDQ